MLLVRPDIGAMVPAAHALRGRGRSHTNPDPVLGSVGRGDGIRGLHCALLHAGRRGDEEKAQLLAQSIQALKMLRRTVDIDLCIEWRADRPLFAQALELP